MWRVSREGFPEVPVRIPGLIIASTEGKDMAQRVHVILEDDIDQSEAVETVTFGLDGKNYEIDLNEENAAEFREVLAPWISHARKAKGSSTRSRRRSSGSNDGPSTKEVREWARSKGWEVSERGRVSAEIREAYDRAH